MYYTRHSIRLGLSCHTHNSMNCLLSKRKNTGTKREALLTFCQKVMLSSKTSPKTLPKKVILSSFEHQKNFFLRVVRMCFTHHSIHLGLSFRMHILRVFKTNFRMLAPSDSKILPKRTLESILLNHSSSFMFPAYVIFFRNKNANCFDEP